MVLNKVIAAPDSFKGTMSSGEICEIMEKSLKAVFPACRVIKIPVADGGEGTVDAMLSAAGGEKREMTVTGPLGDKISSFYGLPDDGKTAVIEMAAAAGLPMVKGREDPAGSTTYGVGQLMAKAAKSRKKLLVGLGGSCTNDGGCGCAAALGVRFYDKQGREFIPTGSTLKNIASIDISRAAELLAGVEIKIMCDVTNPLYGPEGAARVFGPQKGADETMITMLDEGLKHLGSLLEPLMPGVSSMPGGGAAGGMGAGLAAMLGAKLTPGIDGVLETVGFEKMLPGCDMVLTGEGRIDGQSLRGKVINGVCRRAAKAGTPVVAIVGDALDEQLDGAADMGLTAVFTINRRAVPYLEAKATAPRDLAVTVDSIARMIKSMK